MINRLNTHRLIATALLATGMAATARPAAAQSASGATGHAPSLAPYEGVYDYRDGLTATIVAQGDRLVAIIAEAKYVLRPARVDTFTNPGGQAIPFVRGADGHVAAFQEGADRFARRTATLPASVRALLIPRPTGKDGTPPDYTYASPAQLSDGIRVAAAESAGFSPAVAEQLVNGIIRGTYPEVRAMLVYHRGALRLEEYFYGYTRERPHQMRSLTKSVVSLTVGAAVDRGLVQLQEPALAALGLDAYANPDPRKASITLADLLSHQSGLACNDHDAASPGNESKVYETADWMRALVDLPMIATPGTVGRYCSAGIIAAGRVVERRAQRPLRDYANDVLFGPLGVRPTDWRWDFQLNRSGRNEFAQIHLRPRDMLKLGLLVDQQGRWAGRQIISADWIAQATAGRSRVDDSDYGLGIWHRFYHVNTPGGSKRVDTIMMSGNGGQKVYIVPSLELVVVFTGAAFNLESPVNEMMARVLLPALLQ